VARKASEVDEDGHIQRKGCMIPDEDALAVAPPQHQNCRREPKIPENISNIPQNNLGIKSNKGESLSL
jgi:hypothetical protein